MQKIKIGIFGAGARGMSFVPSFLLLNCDIVAVCEFREKQRKTAIKELGSDTAIYEDFDSFIKHDMDAVVLANYFHEHAPYAIKCFEKGLHVFSECISNGTMAEGVELIRAFEKSNSIYMLAENYPFGRGVLEMKRLYQTVLDAQVITEGNHTVASVQDGLELVLVVLQNLVDQSLDGLVLVSEHAHGVLKATQVQQAQVHKAVGKSAASAT